MDNPQEEQKQPASVIVITFDTPNSTVMSISYGTVSPLQVELAAFVLHQSAENAIKSMEQEQKRQQQANKIAVPGQGFGGIIPK